MVKIKLRKAKTLETGRKPHGFWQEWENVECELKGLIKRLGHFPTQAELVQSGYSGMIDAMGSYFGGTAQVRKKLGYDSIQVEHGTWKDLSYAIKEAKKAMRESHSKLLPSQKKLFIMGYSSLCAAIAKYYGGYTNFRQLLGEHNSRDDYNNKDFVLREARKILKKHNLESLPCSEKLKELGYVTLAVAIDKKHGGYRTFRRLLGEEQKCLPSGKLKNRNFILSQLRKIMQQKKCATIPSSYQLNKWGYKSLGYAIYKYHGGFNEIRKSLGEEQRRVKNGSWKSLEYALERAKELLEDNSLDELPAHGRLIKLGGSSLAKAITKYHGGYISFREKLYQYIEKPCENKQLEGLLEQYAEWKSDGK